MYRTDSIACGGPNRLSVYNSAPITALPIPVIQKTNLPGGWQYAGCLRCVHSSAHSPRVCVLYASVRMEKKRNETKNRCVENTGARTIESRRADAGCVNRENTTNRIFDNQIIWIGNNSAIACMNQCAEFGYPASGTEVRCVYSLRERVRVG